MILRLDHCALTVKDLDRSLEFYSGLLGFPILNRKRKPESNVSYALVQAGQLTLEILSPLEGEPSPRKHLGGGMEGVWGRILETTGLNHISLLTDDIEETWRDLKGKGIQFAVNPHTTGSGSKIAFFTDPDGNLIELIQRADRREASA